MYGSFQELADYIEVVERNYSYEICAELFPQDPHHFWNIWNEERVERSLLAYLPLIGAGHSKKIYEYFEVFEPPPAPPPSNESSGMSHGEIVGIIRDTVRGCLSTVCPQPAPSPSPPSPPQPAPVSHKAPPPRVSVTGRATAVRFSPYRNG